ncbi:MAG: 3-oxoacyl-ACP synthase [Deltaproteobacteria bacterium]|nr:MAG: 3-oxoacyl-ACP synthase [Deltaproteobacteria bacterium]
MGSVVYGIGSCSPKRLVANRQLEKIVDTSDEWIRTRTGIETRYIAGANEQTYVLAAEAARRALLDADCSAEQIGIIIVATITSHTQMPSAACLVQGEIGAQNAFAFDLNAACSGFLYAVDLAHRYIQSDPSLKVLVIGAETMSSRLDWQDRNTCILFGDGAAAVVMGQSENDRGFIGSNLQSDGRLWPLLYMYGPQSSNPDLRLADNDGSYLRMEGKEVFRHAVVAMADSVHTLLEDSGLAMDDVSLVVPHQANIRILHKLIEKFQITEDKFFINVARYGNTSAASIPLALDDACRQGRIAENDLILLCSFGGGFTWGSALMKW